MKVTETVSEAVSFLNCVENEKGNRAIADLVLAAYDSKRHGTGVDLLVRLTNY